MSRYLSFCVGGIEDSCTVIGRVCGESIRLGDTFTKLFNSKQVRQDDVVWSELSLVGDIAITIEHIEAYRRAFDELESGMTCRIKVTGDLSAIEDGQILGSEETLAIDQHQLEKFLQSEHAR